MDLIGNFVQKVYISLFFFAAVTPFWQFLWMTLGISVCVSKNLYPFSKESKLTLKKV